MHKGGNNENSENKIKDAWRNVYQTALAKEAQPQAQGAGTMADRPTAGDTAHGAVRIYSIE